MYKAFKQLPALDNVKFYGEFPLVEEMVKDLYLHEMIRQEPLMCGYMTALGAKQVSMDYTFKIAKTGRVSGAITMNVYDAKR